MRVVAAWIFIGFGGLVIGLNWMLILGSRSKTGVSLILWFGGVFASVGFAILPDARLVLATWVIEPGGVPLIVLWLCTRRPKPPP